MSDKHSSNILLGTSGNDRLNGGQADDVITGGGGNDYLDGGPGGYDTAVYSGNYADYSIRFEAGPEESEGYEITVVDKRAGSPDGTDTLRRIDAIRFADGEFRDGRFYPSGPSAQVTAVIALGADTGASSTDFITYQAAQTVTGTYSGSLHAGDLIQISANGSTWVTATASSGTWSANGVTLTAGSGSLVTRTIDSAGHSLAGASHSYVLDTTVAAPSLSAVFTDSGLVGDKITNATTATLSGTAEAGATVKLYDGSTRIATVMADSGGHWTYGVTGLANGAHSFAAKQIDLAGNESGLSAASTMTVDTLAPSAPSLSASFVDSGASATDKITSATTATLSGTAEAGATVKVYDVSTLIATVTANSSGQWTHNATGLADGAHSFTARQMDIAGNLSAASAARAMTVDTIVAAPSLAASFTDSGASGMDKITNASSAILSGVAEKGAPVQVFDGTTLIATVTANASTGAWSYNATGLANGTHSFTARQTDIAGNLSAASAARTMTVDTIVAAPGLLAAFVDSGVSATDKITNATTATLSGTAEAGATVKVYDGSTRIATVTTDSSGHWTYGVTGLANGAHSFAARQIDLAGNESGLSAASTMTVDTVAPSAPSLSASFVDSGVSATDKITNATTATLSGTAVAGATVNVYDVSTLIATVTANSSGQWTHNATGLADGAHSFTARQMDVAGNLSGSSEARRMTVDTVVPAPSLRASFEDSGVSESDAITDATTAKLSGTAEAGATVKVYDGSTLIATVTANSGGEWKYTERDLADGQHSFTARQTDIAGNLSAASAASTMTVDTNVAAPSLVATFVDSGVSATDKITNVTTATLSGTAEAGATVKVYDGSTRIATVTANSSGEWTFVAAGLANGTHSFKARQIDLAGNESGYSSASTMTVDTAAPSAPSLVATFVDSGASHTDHITNATSAILSGVAAKGVPVQVFDGTTEIAAVTANATTGAWSYNVTGLADGAHSFTARQMDIAGNLSAPSAASSMTVDTIAAVELTTPIMLDGMINAIEKTSVTIAGTTTGVETGRTLTLAVTDGHHTVTATTTVAAGGAWSVGGLNLSNLSDGSLAVSVSATDVAGNAASASSTVTLDTNIATPVITAVLDDAGAIHETVASGGTTDDTLPTLTGTAEAGSTVTVYDGLATLGSATADGSGAWTYTATAELIYGAHHFTAQASDAAGNSSTSSAYDVTIRLNHAPALTGTPAVLAAGTEDNAYTVSSTSLLQGFTDADSDPLSLFNLSSSSGTVTDNGDGTYTVTPIANYNGPVTLNYTVTDGVGGGAAATLGFTLAAVNDPAIIGTPTVYSVTEDANVTAGDDLTATGGISIADADAGQASFQTSVSGAPGNLGTLALAPNGAYLYTVDNGAVQYLGANESKVDGFTVTSADGTTGQVSFTIRGANDVALIGSPTTSSVTEDLGVSGGNLTSTGTISISDADAGQATFQTTVSPVAGNLGTLALTAGGSYTYSVANGDVQPLGTSVGKVDSFIISSADGTPKAVSFTINGANDAPAITGTVATLDGGAEDTSYIVGAANLLAGFTDVDGDTLSVTGLVADHGTVTYNANGTYTITPAPNYNGAMALNYAVSDGQGANTAATQGFSLAAVNDAPLAMADTLAAIQETPVIYSASQLLGNDSDGDPELAQALTIASVTSGIGGMAALDVDGSVSFTPAAGFNGPASFTYTASDGALVSAPATVTVDISPDGNDAPELTLPAATLANGTEDYPYTIIAADLLQGYTDANGDTPLLVRELTADHGTVVDDGLGTYTITPTANYNGPMALSYTVSDGHGGNTPATQSFSLAAVNDPALIGTPTLSSVTEDAGVSGGNLTATGSISISDVEAAEANFQPMVVGVGSPLGALVLASGGDYTYTVANNAVQYLGAGATANDVFTVLSADGTTKDVSFTIQGANDAPVAGAQALAASEGGAGVTVDALGTASDTDVPTTLTVSGLPASLPYGVSFNAATHAFTFDPNNPAYDYLSAGVHALVSVNYSVSDGITSTPTSVSFDIEGSNDSAVITGLTGPLNYSVGDPAVLVDNTLTVTDADNGLLSRATVTITNGFSPGNDVLSWDSALAALNGIGASYVSGTGVLSFTGVATLAQYESVLESVKFNTSTPGVRTVSYTVNDGTVDSSPVTTSNISLEDLTTTGFKIPGETAGDNSGAWMSGAGDVNGDGFADLIIGAPNASANGILSTGRGYVVFGKGTAFDPEVPLWSLDGANGFRLSGVAEEDIAGFSVAAAGDVNGDGFGDVIIGAIYSDPNGAQSGAGYVVFGKASGFGPDFQLSALTGANGFRLDGASAQDQTGISVSGVGDVNGDGYADVLIGSYAQPSGASYLVFGKASFSTSDIQLSALDGINGFRIAGENPGDNAGQRVSAAGDLNGDGFADFVIGAPGAGADYVVFGKAAFFGQTTADATLDLSSLDGNNGFRILELASGDGMGYGINNAGDINGDGFDELIVSAAYATVDGVASGASYVVFGKANGFEADVDLAALDGTSGFRISGGPADSLIGTSVSAAGDFNGDGFGDLIVGAPGVYGSTTWSGESYVVFGKATGFSANLSLATLGGSDGFRVSGVANGDASGYNVSAAGDVNGDGFDDIAVASAFASPNGQAAAGETYVIFGAKLVVGGETFLGTTGSDTLTGTTAAENFIGGQGNDTIYGNGGRDALSGGAGDDTVHLGASGQSAIDFVKIDGGSGVDTLALDGSIVMLDFTASGADRVQGIEQIDLSGSGNNGLVLDIRDLLNMSDSGNTLRVDGNSGDSVDVKLDAGASPWTPGADQTIGGVLYHSYAQGVANLLVDQDVTVNFV